nr:MAG TPA_asm: hypothetical protein [Bacteriophage sp.]
MNVRKSLCVFVKASKTNSFTSFIIHAVRWHLRIMRVSLRVSRFGYPQICP